MRVGFTSDPPPFIYETNEIKIKKSSKVRRLCVERTEVGTEPVPSQNVYSAWSGIKGTQTLQKSQQIPIWTRLDARFGGPHGNEHETFSRVRVRETVRPTQEGRILN